MATCDRNSQLAVPLATLCGEQAPLNCLPTTDGVPDWTPAADQIGIAVDAATQTVYFYDCDAATWISITGNLCALDPVNIANINNLCSVLEIPVVYDVGGNCVSGTVQLQDLAEAMAECVPGLCALPPRTQAQVDAAASVQLAACVDDEEVLIPLPRKICEFDPATQGQVDSAGTLFIGACLDGEERQIPYPPQPCEAPLGGDLQDGDPVLSCDGDDLEQKTYRAYDPCGAGDGGDFIEATDRVKVCRAGTELLVGMEIPEGFDPCDLPDAGPMIAGDKNLICRGDVPMLADPAVAEEEDCEIDSTALECYSSETIRLLGVDAGGCPVNMPALRGEAEPPNDPMDVHIDCDGLITVESPVSIVAQGECGEVVVGVTPDGDVVLNDGSYVRRPHNGTIVGTVDDVNYDVTLDGAPVGGLYTREVDFDLNTLYTFSECDTHVELVMFCVARNGAYTDPLHSITEQTTVVIRTSHTGTDPYVNQLSVEAGLGSWGKNTLKYKIWYPLLSGNILHYRIAAQGLNVNSDAFRAFIQVGAVGRFPDML